MNSTKIQNPEIETVIHLNGIRKSGLGYLFNLIRSGGINSSSIKIRGGREAVVSASNTSEKKSVLAIHIAREPLACIAALRDLSEDQWKSICEHGKDEHPRVTMDDTPLRRSMRYYYDANKFQRSKSTRTLRIETITPGVMKDLFGIDVDDVALATEVNKEHHRVVVWGDLKREDIRLSMAVADLGRAYGYDTPVIEDGRVCGGCV